MPLRDPQRRECAKADSRYFNRLTMGIMAYFDAGQRCDVHIVTGIINRYTCNSNLTMNRQSQQVNGNQMVNKKTKSP